MSAIPTSKDSKSEEVINEIALNTAGEKIKPTFVGVIIITGLLGVANYAVYLIYTGKVHPAIVFRGMHFEIFGPTTATIIYTVGALFLTLVWLNAIKNFPRK